MHTVRKRPAFRILMLGLSGLLAGAFITSCNALEKKTEETQQTTETVQSDTGITSIKSEWEKFKQEANEKISESGDSIDVYKKRMAKADKKLKMKYTRKVAELEQKKSELKKELEDYKDEGKGKWEGFKTSFNQQMDKLKQELKDSTTYNSK